MWRYCQLDLQGARLSARASGSEEIASLMVAPAKRDGGKVVVSSACELGAISKTATTARVTLTYRNLGSLTADGELLPPERRSEVVRFQLKKVGNDWKISGPVILPHATPQALRALWQHRADTTNDAYVRQTAKSVLERLDRIGDEDKPDAGRENVSSKKSEGP